MLKMYLLYVETLHVFNLKFKMLMVQYDLDKKDLVRVGKRSCFDWKLSFFSCSHHKRAGLGVSVVSSTPKCKRELIYMLSECGMTHCSIVQMYCA